MSAVTQTEDWRTKVPERFRTLHDVVTVSDIAKIFGYTSVYVRRLRQARVQADSSGNTDHLIMAFPRAIDGFQRPLYWRTFDVLEWGMQTGRLDCITGEARRLPSSGRKPKATMT